jgi:hypothetical protein
LKLDWQTGNTRVLVDYVANPESVGAFPGLYFAHPETNPWINDNQIILTSRWGFSHVRVVELKIEKLKTTKKIISLIKKYHITCFFLCDA